MLHFVADRVKRDGFDADGMSPPSLVVRLSRKKHPPGQRSWPGCLQLGLSRLRLERAILIDELDLLAQPSTDHGVVNIEAASTGNINLDWTLGGSGYRHVWVHRNGGLFFGAAEESDQGD